MDAPERTIAHFLESKVAREYSLKNYSIFVVVGEIHGGAKKLMSLYDDEIKRVSEFRKDLANALAKTPAIQPAVAANWIHLLKPRIEVLEYWSWLFGALIAVLALITTLFAIAGNSTVIGNSVLASLALIFTMVKFTIDKKRFWYKYISSHLDVIRLKKID
jgi:hypothetical protein